MSYPYYTVTPIAAGRNSTIEVFPVGRRAVIGVDIPFSLLCYPLGSGDEEFQARCDTIQHYYDEKARVRRRYDYPDGRQRYSRDCRCTLRVQKDRHQEQYQKKEALHNAATRDARREHRLMKDFMGTINPLHLRYHAGDPDVECLGTYTELEEYFF